MEISSLAAVASCRITHREGVAEENHVDEAGGGNLIGRMVAY